MFIVRDGPRTRRANFFPEKRGNAGFSFSRLEELCSLDRTTANKGAGQFPLSKYSAFSVHELSDSINTVVSVRKSA